MNKQSTIKKNNPVVFMLKSNIGIISVMFIIAIGLTLLTPKFMTVNNVISVLRQISNNVFLALGMTMVIILGGIDLFCRVYCSNERHSYGWVYGKQRFTDGGGNRGRSSFGSGCRTGKRNNCCDI